jgi:SAM-dependent methyltransferase
MKCRHCHADLTLRFIDLDTAPPSNSYLSAAQLSAPEKWYPLRLYTCTACWLVQTEDFAGAAELFPSDYAYFSSISSTWLAHAERYVEEVTQRLNLTATSQVFEVASNDGYLLQYFKNKGIPCVGIEPTASTAQAARDKGIEVIEDFFGISLAARLAGLGLQADLIVANNVLAHVPDINDFVSGFALLLKPHGVATFEFPHLLRLVSECQFDTIYHEHFSYLSLTSVCTIFERNGLCVIDVQDLPTHGGSLRVFAQSWDTGMRARNPSVLALLEKERTAGVTSEEYYRALQFRADQIKDDLLTFLIQARREKKIVGGYGAAAKGNTLLNYAGARASLLPWVADRNPAKQGKFLPGSRIPIVNEEFLRQRRPDYVLVLPWNLRGEIMAQLSYIRNWGGIFVAAIPRLELA